MIILIDMDGVLADFDLGFDQIWRQRFPQRAQLNLANRQHLRISDELPEFKDEIIALYKEQGFYLNLPEISGAVQAMRQMLDLGAEVFICSSPLMDAPYCAQEKYLWVEQHLGKDWVKRIILTRNKAIVKANYLIDDLPIHANNKNAEWELLLFDQPFNKMINGFTRISWTNWQGAIKL